MAKLCGEECDELREQNAQLRRSVQELVKIIREHAPGKLPKLLQIMDDVKQRESIT